MTPEEKIAALVEHVKAKFPNGCRDIPCDSNCPLHRAQGRTMEHAICEMLDKISR